MLVLVTGCAIKQYTKPEFYSLQSVKQKELCQEWVNTIPGDITLTTYSVRYPTSGDYNISAEMRADAASLGSAVGAYQAKLSKKRASYNLSYCTSRHFAIDLPEGYSTYFLNKKEIVFLRTEADSLNIKATRLALDGKLNDAIKASSQALKIQENPYTYQIRAAVFILAAQKENSAILKKKYFENSVESSTNIIDKFKMNADDLFLKGYALYQLKQNKNSAWPLTWGPLFYIKGRRLIFNTEHHIYQSLLTCTDSDIYFKADEKFKDTFDKGIFYLNRAKEILENDKPANNASLVWLEKSIANTENICRTGKAQQRYIGRTELVMPSELFISYLDDVKFRGFKM